MSELVLGVPPLLLGGLLSFFSALLIAGIYRAKDRAAWRRRMRSMGPDAYAATRSGLVDDLKRIQAIDAKLETALRRIGVTSYQQVGDWTGDDVVRVSRALELGGRIEQESWIEQAKILASGGETKFSRQLARGEVAVPMVPGAVPGENRPSVGASSRVAAAAARPVPSVTVEAAISRQPVPMREAFRRGEPLEPKLEPPQPAVRQGPPSHTTATAVAAAAAAAASAAAVAAAARPIQRGEPAPAEPMPAAPAPRPPGESLEAMDYGETRSFRRSHEVGGRLSELSGVSPDAIRDLEQRADDAHARAQRQRDEIASFAGRLVHQIPEAMCKGVRETVEVRLGAADQDQLAAGLAGRGALVTEELKLVETMTVQLLGASDAFLIAAQSPPTQDVSGRASRRVGLVGQEFGRWVWDVTPLKAGTHELVVKVTAHFPDTRGIPTAASLPDKLFKLNVAVNFAKTSWTWLKWLGGVAVTAMLGAALKDYWWPIVKDWLEKL